MNSRNNVFLVVFAILFGFSVTCWAQDSQDNEKETSSDGESPDSSASANEETTEDAKNTDDNSNIENADNEDADNEDAIDLDSEGDIDLDNEDAIDLDTEDELGDPDDMELDMDALGEINPEEDLSDGGFILEDNASSFATEHWTERGLEILELHGYFRVRPELYHKFYIRKDYAFDHNYTPAVRQQTGVNYCGDSGTSKCAKNTLAGANLRFRLEPTINISEDVWVKTQIDFLDNVMLGSTPLKLQYWTSGDTMDSSDYYSANQGGGGTMVNVRRAWAEVMTPLGRLSFGRMPSHWGMGLVHNSGNGIDQDFGDSVDRIAFATKINNWLIMPAFDFPNEGISMNSASGRPFDVSQLDDAHQLVGIFAYQHDAEDQRAMLKRGDWVINTGVHFSYRWQTLDLEIEQGRADSLGSAQFYKRDMWLILPDFWFEYINKTFHLELEVAFKVGEINNSSATQSNDEATQLNIMSWGGALRLDYGLLSDNLRLGFEFGFASGDKNVEGLNAPSNFDQINGSDDMFSQFAFNPSYNVDLILHHHVLGSVSGTYYLKPWISYDILKNAMGKRFGIEVDAIFTRAVYAKSTLSDDSANLGIELNGMIKFVTADNFHAIVKYGILFPLAGFKGDWVNVPDDTGEYNEVENLEIPQTLQLLLGVSF